ncbi:hypothetical protein BN946_scf184759.g29 [Trametes cinnabarina]|uniref:DUF6533 domain-containing protein n=1 Tax=Pycnoporus cinnabarinus TaxID=5643 RepID=A0A060SBC4_PYCCI|nr:hypothetical protein BN946_scf184759.g29 [Trametes cinnabarina]
MCDNLIARDLFTLNAQYFEDLFITRCLSVAGYAILLYECLVTFPDEVQYIWPTRWSAVKVIYMLNRYGNLLLIGLANAQLTGLWWSQLPSFCFRITLVLSFFQFVSFASIHVLVLLRAWATWGRRKKMLTLLVIFLILECAIFFLTMASIRQYKVHRQFKEQSALVQVICRDAIAYFLVTLFSNLFNILTWTRDANRPLNMLSNTFTLCLMIVAGQRLVIDLRKETNYDSLSSTRLGREIERAIEALPRSRSPSPIIFVDGEAGECISSLPDPIASHELPCREKGSV